MESFFSEGDNYDNFCIYSKVTDIYLLNNRLLL